MDESTADALLQEGSSLLQAGRWNEARPLLPLALPAGEIPATSKPLRLDAATVSRVNRDGEVVEERRYFDLAGLLNQIGALS
jgi:hypothetical protein